MAYGVFTVIRLIFYMLLISIGCYRCIVDVVYVRGIEMSLVRCPECGTCISEKARICPHCGYKSNDVLIPQYLFHPTPSIISCGEKWEIIPISDEDNDVILRFLSNHEYLKVIAPGLAETITTMFRKNKQLLAAINEFTQSIIEM